MVSTNSTFSYRKAELMSMAIQADLKRLKIIAKRNLNVWTLCRSITHPAGNIMQLLHRCIIATGYIKEILLNHQQVLHLQMSFEAVYKDKFKIPADLDRESFYHFTPVINLFAMSLTQNSRCYNGSMRRFDKFSPTVQIVLSSRCRSLILCYHQKIVSVMLVINSWCLLSTNVCCLSIICTLHSRSWYA